MNTVTWIGVKIKMIDTYFSNNSIRWRPVQYWGRILDLARMESFHRKRSDFQRTSSKCSAIYQDNRISHRSARFVCLPVRLPACLPACLPLLYLGYVLYILDVDLTDSLSFSDFPVQDTSVLFDVIRLNWKADITNRKPF